MESALPSQTQLAPSLDPRIRRSRRMLHAALGSLMAQTPFEKISIQQIAETATLNRATFYDHYPDKFTLLRCMVGSRFEELLARRGLQPASCEGALRALILASCEFLDEIPLAPAEGGRKLPAAMQNAVIDILRSRITEGIQHHPAQRDTSPEVLAAIVAWAIFGGVSAWADSADRTSAEQLADAMEGLLAPLLEHQSAPA